MTMKNSYVKFFNRLFQKLISVDNLKEWKVQQMQLLTEKINLSAPQNRVFVRVCLVEP